MKFQPLDEKWTQPRVALLDDRPSEVENLINHLSANGFEIKHFRVREEFMAAIHTSVYPIQLIDVSLHGYGDADGFEVASACAKEHPEALRICISGKLDNLPPRTVVAALNARHDDSLQLSLPTSLGLRDIWAIYDKEDAYEGLRNLIEGYRELVGCGDERQIWVDDELKRDFDEGFQSIRWNETGVIHEPQVQVIEIVRQLARRPGMPPVQKITLEKLGKGRSRTIVARMLIEFEGPSRKGGSKLVHKERQSIIKIGRLKSIQREMANYTEYLPQIFSATFYPNVEATGVSRNLAGISYSCLSDEERRVAPTLLDALHGIGSVSEEQALRALDRAFMFKDANPIELSSRLTGISLLGSYSERFTDLKRPNVGSSSQHEPARTLLETLKKANLRLCDCGIGTLDGNGQITLNIAGACITDHNTLEHLTANIKFEDYWSSIGHGDLHLDNILVIPQGTDRTNFYIDFADAGPQHVMLDFVVMDAAARFQSIKFLSDIYSCEQELVLLKSLISMEEALWNQEEQWNPREEKLSSPIREWLLRTWRIASHIRRNTWRFLDENFRHQVTAKIEAEGGVRMKMTPDREVECERQRFICGLGLSALSAMHLRQADALQSLHETWFAVVSQLYLFFFNRWKATGLPEQPTKTSSKERE